MRGISLIASIGLSVLGGCAYNPSDYYDVNAIEKTGLVKSKQVVAYERRLAGDSPFVPVFSVAPSLFAATLAAQVALEKHSDTPIYDYSIQVTKDENIVVRTEYPAFKIGECVKVFLSNNPKYTDYPRITGASGCKP